MLPFLIIDLRFSFLIWILRKIINAKFLQINCLIKILFPEAVFDHMNVSIFNAFPFEVSKAIKAFIDKDKTAIKNNVYAFRIWQVLTLRGITDIYWVLAIWQIPLHILFIFHKIVSKLMLTSLALHVRKLITKEVI